MDEQEELPQLLDIFTKIVLDRKDYCFVCLRTRDERRLLKPDNLMKFVAAAKINTNGNVHFVCYVCERQVLNALKVFRAVLFASSLGLILTELKRRTVNNQNTKLMLEKKYFKRLVIKLNMSSKLTPASVNDEVQVIRNNCNLLETDTLVMDNTQVYEAGPTPTVVAMTTRQAGVNNGEVFRNAVVQCPIERCATPCILPDKLEHKSPLESIVIDDEDDPLEPPHAQNITQTPPPESTQPAPNSNIHSNLFITLDPPQLRPLSEILSEKFVEPKKFLLHPVFLTENDELDVPSLSACIVNNSLVFYDNASHTVRATALNVDTNIVKEHLKANRDGIPPKSNSTVNPNFRISDVEKKIANNISTCPQKKMKIDGSLLREALVDKNEGSCSKVCTDSTVREVQISDVRCHLTDQVSKSDVKTTDWEDKIPMDVISFMDAVDPNADEVLKTPAPNCDHVQVGNVRSLARHKKKKEPDVIDLC